jgi:hypothetical protein
MANEKWKMIWLRSLLLHQGDRDQGNRQESPSEFMNVGIEPAKHGDSIKPGVERSGTPGTVRV